MSSAAPHLSSAAFDWFKEIEANNNRDWYLANKKRFDTQIEAPFVALLDAVTLRLQDADLPLIGSKKTMFRMNRDVRFSNDKSPYKTSVSALLTPSGTKSEADGLMYLQIGREGAFLAAGIHNATPAQLAPVRDAIIADADGFSEMLAQLKSSGLSLWAKNSLTSMPRGYAEHSDHPHAPVIRLKTVVVQKDLSPDACMSADLPEVVATFGKGAAPLLAFLRGALA